MIIFLFQPVCHDSSPRSDSGPKQPSQRLPPAPGNRSALKSSRCARHLSRTLTGVVSKFNLAYSSVLGVLGPALALTYLSSIRSCTSYMSASRALSRTLLTRGNSYLRTTLPATATRSSAARQAAQRITYNKLPALSQQRFFSATMGKEGVHNLKNKAEFDEARATKGTLMVVDCYATWCGPCKVIAPQVVK